MPAQGPQKHFLESYISFRRAVQAKTGPWFVNGKDTLSNAHTTVDKTPGYVLSSIPVNEFGSCIFWSTMKNMKDMKRMIDKMKRVFQPIKNTKINITQSVFVPPLSGSYSGLLHVLHALHGKIQNSQQRWTSLYSRVLVLSSAEIKRSGDLKEVHHFWFFSKQQ